MIRFALFVFATAVFTLTGTAAERPRMLMVTQSAGFRHQPVKREGKELCEAEVAMIQLGQSSRLFDVDCTQDVAADFTRDNLQRYQLVMFYTTGNLPIADEDLDYFLSDWLHQSGHGFIGVHSATDTYKKHEPYWDMVGGSFNGHPWSAGSRVTITVHEPNHPTMKPFGSSFEYQDEIYQYFNWQPEKVRVLMSLDMAKTKIKRPYHVPVAWVKQVGEGRVFVNNLGHRMETWSEPRYLESLIGAIKWIRGMEDGNAAPNPDVSAAQHKASEVAAHAAGITKETLAAEQRAKEAAKKARAAKKRK